MIQMQFVAVKAMLNILIFAVLYCDILVDLMIPPPLISCFFHVLTGKKRGAAEICESVKCSNRRGILCCPGRT